MSRYAIIDEQTGAVVNVIEYESEPGNPPPGFDAHFVAVQNDEAGIGWSYIGGAFVAPVNPVIVLPVTEITPRQARLALLQAGLLDQVEATVQQQPRAVQLTWDYATVIYRDNPLISQVATSLGMSAQQIDQLFATAATL